jgi:DNA-binding response OmpR family regulator
MTLVAIVEDETAIAEILAAYLEREGYATQRVASGTEAERWLRHGKPDLILLDLMLPGIDGLTLCRRIRETMTVPIIMVTARVEEIDRLLGLELGADDYICKPFSPREVLARVKSVLRRAAWHAAGGATATGTNGLAIDAESFTARLNGTRLDVTPTEFRLLQALARRPGHVLSRAQLLDAIAEPGRDVFERSIDSHIKNLRRKLAACGAGELIQSIYGVGYRLESVE